MIDKTAGDQVRTAYLVKQLELAVRARLDAMVRAYGLTTPQYVALTVLRAMPGMSSAELARHSFVSAQAMQEMIVALERKDLVRREPDPTNRRILRAHLTKRGERVLVASDPEFDLIETDMTADLNEDQVAGLRQALRTCIQRLAKAQQGE